MNPTPNRARAVGVSKANFKMKILTKWTGLDHKFEKLASLTFPASCTLLKSLTCDSLFYVDEKKLVIISLGNLATRTVKVPEFSPVNLTLLYNKFLIGELVAKADKFKIVVFDINANTQLACVKKRISREKLYVMPNENLEPQSWITY